MIRDNCLNSQRRILERVVLKEVIRVDHKIEARNEDQNLLIATTLKVNHVVIQRHLYQRISNNLQLVNNFKMM